MIAILPTFAAIAAWGCCAFAAWRLALHAERGRAWRLMLAAILILVLREALVLGEASETSFAARSLALLSGLLFLFGLLALGDYFRRLRHEHAEVRRDDDNFFDMAGDLLCVANIEGQFLRVNPAWERMLGYPLDTLLSMPYLNFVHPDDLENTQAAMAALAEGREVRRFENRYRASDGTYRWLGWSARPDLSRNRVYAIAEDISELRAAREHLEGQVRERTRELEEAYRRLDDGAARLREAQRIGQMGHWEMELPSRQLLWSDEVYRLYELDPTGPAPSYEQAMATCDPQDAAALVETVEAVIADGQERVGEFRVCLPSGRCAVHQSRVCARRDADGGIVRLVGVVQDITERKRAEEERRDMEARVLRAQKLESLGVLAGGVAHDFNNLLMAILGYAHLIQDECADASGRHHATVIVQAAERAAALTAQMLAYTGHGLTELRPTDLSARVRELLDVLRVSLRPEVRLESQLPSGLPAVRADDTQIGQVVMNLVMNAAEALGTAPGAVRVRTGVARRGAAELMIAQTQEPMPAGEYVFLEVEDEGCGMPPEVVDRIFDPFFTTKFTGRGLGLASVVGILRAHGGTIEVHSEVGSGTLMRVHLPALPGALPAAPVSTGPAGAGGRVLRVLVVDDEDMVRRVTARVLERAGHTVVQAADGREALECIEDAQGRLDLVLLDLTMPGMDGAATLRELQFRWPALRVVVMSGFAEQQAMERLAGLAAVQFLQKPLTPDTLLATVRAATLHSNT